MASGDLVDAKSIIGLLAVRAAIGWIAHPLPAAGERPPDLGISPAAEAVAGGGQ
jgi:hypothetical protein